MDPAGNWRRLLPVLLFLQLRITPDTANMDDQRGKREVSAMICSPAGACRCDAEDGTAVARCDGRRVTNIRHLLVTGGDTSSGEVPHAATRVTQWRRVTTSTPVTITALHLDNNRIATIDTRDFHEVLQGASADVTDVSLERSHVHSIRPRAFDGLHNLVYLNLNRNKLRNITGDMFAGVNNLQILTISRNKVTSVEPRAFASLTQLRILDMSFNGIARLNFIDGSKLAALEELNLEGNSVRFLTKGAFGDLPLLRYLNMRYNRLVEIRSGSFAGADNLHDLLLSYNNISRVHGAGLTGLRSLRSLDLTHNRIRGLDGDMLTALSKLRSLHLGHNLLSTLDMPKLLHTLPALRMMGVADNPITSVSGTGNNLAGAHGRNRGVSTRAVVTGVAVDVTNNHLPCHARRRLLRSSGDRQGRRRRVTWVGVTLCTAHTGTASGHARRHDHHVRAANASPVTATASRVPLTDWHCFIQLTAVVILRALRIARSDPLVL